MRRILKWTVRVNDRWQQIGGGRVVYVDCQTGPDSVEVWTDEPDAEMVTMKWARVFATGQPLPEHAEHVGTVMIFAGKGRLVWHVLRSDRDEG